MPEPPTPTLIPTEAALERSNLARQAPPPAPPPQGRKPKLKKLRLVLVLLGLSALAVISTLFGMLMAVASDLPSLEDKAQYNAAKNSFLYFDDPDNPDCKDFKPSCRLARMTGNENRILLNPGQISPHIKNAVIAIEDRRFYEHNGVDYKGIARAFTQDVLRKSAAQGGSTITQQFVKNALQAQGDRSVFQKLREAALAYHLERQWPKDKILTQYLNTVYFGSGAYGIESAVRTYFGNGDDIASQSPTGLDPAAETDPLQDEDRHYASDVSPAQAALLAGMIASPTAYDPVQNPRQARQRRNLVLQRMLEQHYITRVEYRDGVRAPLPDEDQVSPPKPDSEQPYFSSWVTQQLVDRYGAGRVFGRGLEITTTIDPELQAAAEQAIAGRLTGVGPSASLVAIENKTGKIRAMVGGTDYDTTPFNLATQGHRQPGSAFKPFTLIRALADGVSPDQTFSSQPKTFKVTSKENFNVHNYEDIYYGTPSLRAATAASDNSVFAELGIKTGTRRIARLAQRMGIRTKVSHNYAMILGGLEEGVTPLEMAYAYSTIANKGLRVSGSLAPDGEGPVAIERVRGDGLDDVDKTQGHTKRVYSAQVGETAQELLGGVVYNGTGKAAQVQDEFIFGKTGTTENYGDAWFVGSNGEMTVAVWVGYPDRLQPMETEYHGGPVAGGTYPAEIFHDFMTSYVGIRDTRNEAKGKDDENDQETAPAVPVVPVNTPPAEQSTAPADSAPAAPEDTPDQPAEPAPQDQAPEQPPPDQPTAPPTPPATEPPATGGGGDGGGVTPGGTTGQ
jgi:penicillin-binding protein 1A